MSSMMSSRLPRPQNACTQPAAASSTTSSGWRSTSEPEHHGDEAGRLHSWNSGGSGLSAGQAA